MAPAGMLGIKEAFQPLGACLSLSLPMYRYFATQSGLAAVRRRQQPSRQLRHRFRRRAALQAAQAQAQLAQIQQQQQEPASQPVIPLSVLEP